MGRDAATPRTARALAAFLAEHPLVWVCGLSGGAFAGVVSRIDGDAIEVTAVADGRRRCILLPAGWNDPKKKPPVRTPAIREAFRFDEAGFRVSCIERRSPEEVLELHVRYIDERSPFPGPGPAPPAGRRRAVRGTARRANRAEGGRDETT
jgi:hypothetical protein